MAPSSREPRAAMHPPVARPPTPQTRTGRPLGDGPPVHVPTTMEGYFFAAFLVFFTTFLGAFGFALRVPIVFATFRS